MSLAQFKAISLDAYRPARLARFWANALNATPVELRDGTARIDDIPSHHGETSIWISPAEKPVPHPVRVRLGIELHDQDLAALTAAGAVVHDNPSDAHPWWTLADPEGNPFRAHRFTDGPAGRPRQACELTVECDDPNTLAGWWATVTAGRVMDGSRIVDAAGFPWPSWTFEPAGQPKNAKNRLYWEVSLTEPSPDGLVRLGATVLRGPDADIDWWIMADPEGNEFCAFPPA
ncbi:hypothetical protein F4553_007951 [Allocatelliglobosispora scoriae]|uniref:Glyoxalase-like domain-containing protein n=1 Tax=Allocatelliglobosispora scoriae TaxID=643052 RepID=A0A841BZD6_9ACTN|nr:VOC family protein [Allocatelliglobosispora scoriae]MBB5874517.1 hypothetical protein [Allocatelliglobosispora scoriae]